MSDEKAAQERFWLQKMVREITGTNQPDEKSAVSVEVKKQDQPIVVGHKFWPSDMGLIVRPIVLSRAYKKETILKVSGLTDLQYRNVATALFKAGLFTEKYPGSLRLQRSYT